MITRMKRFKNLHRRVEETGESKLFLCGYSRINNDKYFSNSRAINFTDGHVRIDDFNSDCCELSYYEVEAILKKMMELGYEDC